MTISTNSATFGDSDITVSATGQITGGSTNVPNPSIDSVQYEGTITPTTCSVNYTITFSNGGGIAEGVVNLTNQ